MVFLSGNRWEGPPGDNNIFELELVEWCRQLVGRKISRSLSKLKERNEYVEDMKECDFEIFG